jgi:hypothetical protein
VASGQHNHLTVLGEEKRIPLRDNRIDPLLLEGRESRVDLAFAAGVYDLDLPSKYTSRR